MANCCSVSLSACKHVEAEQLHCRHVLKNRQWDWPVLKVLVHLPESKQQALLDNKACTEQGCSSLLLAGFAAWLHVPASKGTLE